MSELSTHILDTTTGRPVAGVKVRHSYAGVAGARAVTNSEGRIANMLKGQGLQKGNHTLTFEVGPYFADHKIESFYSEIHIDFVVTDTERNYHLPLLLSPFSFTSYRGS